MMMTIHCIAKLEVCSYYAAKLGTPGHDTHQSIESFSKRHLKTLNLIDMVISVYKFANLGQLLSTLGLFVIVTFQTRFSFDYSIVLIFVLIMIQLFLYCSASELVYSAVSFMHFTSICDDSVNLIYLVRQTPVYSLQHALVWNRRHQNSKEDPFHADGDAEKESLFRRWFQCHEYGDLCKHNQLWLQLLDMPQERGLMFMCLRRKLEAYSKKSFIVKLVKHLNMSVSLLHKVDVVNKIGKWKCWIFKFSAIFQQSNAFLSATFFST